MFSLFFLLSAAAAEPQFTRLDEGEPAPWAGRLFNDEAVARFLVEDKYKVEQCDIITSYQLQMQSAQLDLTHQKNVIELETQIKILEEKVSLRDERIQSLEKLKKPPNAFLWSLGGFVIGSAATIGITYAVNQ